MPHVPDFTPFHGGDSRGARCFPHTHMSFLFIGETSGMRYPSAGISGPSPPVELRGASPLSEFLIRKSKRSSRIREYESTQSVDNHLYKYI